ncbi:MAG: DUF1501 domain-containing protein [Thermoanaerobaculia bacterium]
MSDHECKTCDEYRELTRRGFVGVTAGAVAFALTPSWLPKVVYADSDDSQRDIVVSLFLRGGADGLTLCPPFGDTAYYDLRPQLAFQPPDASGGNAALDLDGEFGLAPALEPLLEVYNGGDLLLVHATGLPDATRSHFEAMHFMEVGQGYPPPSLFSGWLGRHLQTTAPTAKDAVLRAVGIGAGLQRTLAGGPQALPIQDLDDYGFEGRGATKAARRVAVEEMFAAVGDPEKTAAANTFRTIDLLKTIGFTSYSPAGGAAYPDGEFGYALESTAALIKAEVGVEAVAIDLGGWDTHVAQGPVEGFMAGLMGNLAGGLAAFHQDLTSDGFDNVLVVAMSEFGRNAFENGSAGTDHGHGGLMFVIGGGVKGGRVLTEWPGLEQAQLYDGQDLAITIDYRDILSELLEKRLANPDATKVFTDSGYSPKTYGIAV